MARSVITSSITWTEIATGPAIITIKGSKDGKLYFNNRASDTARLEINSSESGLQVVENEVRGIFCRSDTAGWTMVVDTGGST